MARTKAAISVTSAALALALTATACSSSSGDGSQNSTGSGSPTTSMSMSGSGSSGNSATGTTTASAQLRAGLTALLRQHVNLTAFVVQTAVADGLTSKNTSNAEAALDANTVALGKAIGSVYGNAADTAFVKMWRAHIGFFVNYTKGLATKDNSLVSTAQTDLDGYRADFSKFINSATDLPASAVSADLQGHVQTLEAAIQAIVGGDSDAASKIQMAAEHMDGTAQVLASGIAKNKSLAGNPDGTASTLQAALTGLLIQHVAQTVTVVATAKKTSLTSAQTKAAISALDENTVALGKAIGSVYGNAADTAFVKMWRAHIGFFVNYTKGLATNDISLVSTAQTDLDGYRADFSKFLNTATGLPASAVSADLQGHVQTLEAAIKAILTNDPNAASLVSAAETHMAGTAAVLAGGIAKQKNYS